jgi:hypothetical protein
MRTSVQKTLIALLAGGVTIGVASCQEASSPDRTGAAEEAIAAQILDELKVASVATCDEPTADTPGTSFMCTADADDGNTYRFVATIVDDRQLTVALKP